MVWVKSLGIVLGFLIVAGLISAAILASPPWLFFALLGFLVVGYVRYTLYEDE